LERNQPGNSAQKLVFDAVIFRMISSSAAESCHCKWNGIDIEEVDIYFVFIFTAKLTRMAFEITQSVISFCTGRAG
jgi:hypothetical protein